MSRWQGVLGWGMVALALGGCGTLTWPLGRSRQAETSVPAPVAPPAAAPAPAPPPAARPPAPLSLGEQVARLSEDVRALEASLANAVAANRRQEDQLRFVERRLSELERRSRGAAVPGTPAVPATPPSAPPPTTSSTVTVPPEELFATGQARYRAGEPDAAILKLYELISAHPFHPLRERAQLLVAQILMEQKDFRGAKGELENLLVAVPAGPMTPEALLRIGTCQRSLGQEAQARETWQRLLREYPTNPAAEEARRLLGEGGKG